MPKKMELSAEERAQRVLRFLSKEDSAANLARRAAEAERWHRPLVKRPFPVTDTSTGMSGAAQRVNGPELYRPAFPEAYPEEIRPCAYSLSHARAAGVA